MDRRVVLLVLLLGEGEGAAAGAVVGGVRGLAPAGRVVVVDGRSPLGVLVPLGPAGRLPGVPHLPPGEVVAAGLHARLGLYLAGVQVQLEVDDGAPQGYVVACVWGAAGSGPGAADLGGCGALRALACPVEVRHYFLGGAGGVRAAREAAGAGVSVVAWRGADPAAVGAHVAAAAGGVPCGLEGGVPVDLGARPGSGGAGAAGRVGRPGPRGGASPMVVVDVAGRGDFVSLAAAVSAAAPGSRIVVRPGRYEGPILMDKALEIVGEGDRGAVVVSAAVGDVVSFSAAAGRVENLTLRRGAGGSGHGVRIGRGRLELLDCDISSESWACVAVSGGAAPVVRGNRIHDGKNAGVLVYDGGGGEFVGNDISGNAKAGVAVGGAGSAPVVRGNRIRDGKDAGVLVYDGGGEFVDNDITGNAGSGVVVKSGAAPVVRGNRIRDGKRDGVYVRHGGGEFVDNDITGNALAGVVVSGAGSAPVVRGNRIRDGKSAGVRVEHRGAGKFVDNDIVGNFGPGVSVRYSGSGEFRGNDISGNGAGVVVAAGGAPVVRGNRIRDGKGVGVRVRHGGGEFVDNDISGNTGAGVEVGAGGAPVVRENRIRDGKSHGVFVRDGGGEFVDNDISGNTGAGVEVRSGGAPVVRGNRIRDGKGAGVLVRDGGAGEFRDNDLRGNKGGAWAVAWSSRRRVKRVGNRK